jgi:hypothetical protein
MSRAPTKFRQADITKAIQGATKAGLSVSRVEIDATGKIVVICAEGAPDQSESSDGWEARLRKARGWDK